MYRIFNHADFGYIIEAPNGELLRDRHGLIRIFKTRNSARKRISREKWGDFHN